MSSTKSPAFRFYPSDFWGSPDVQAMDLHEVGAYLSLLSSAWLSDRPGALPDDDERFRRWSRLSRDQWTQSRDTLLSKFPVIEPGWRGNSRLMLEAEKQLNYSQSQSEKGRKGGRPKGGGKPELSPEKPGLSVGLSPEKPSVSVSASASASASDSVAGQKAERVSSPAATLFLDAWNSNCGSLPKVSKLTGARHKRIAARIKAGLTVEDFVEAVRKAAATPFLCGDNERQWKGDFDFLLRENTYTKLLEGSYGRTEESGTHEELLRKLLQQPAQGGGFECGTGRPFLVPGTPEYKARQRELREAALGRA